MYSPESNEEEVKVKDNDIPLEANNDSKLSVTWQMSLIAKSSSCSLDVQELKENFSQLY